MFALKRWKKLMKTNKNKTWLLKKDWSQFRKENFPSSCGLICNAKKRPFKASYF